MTPAPDLDRHFIRGSLFGLLMRGHPYDFADTYRAMQAIHGYRAFYVNLGLWPAGAASARSLPTSKTIWPLPLTEMAGPPHRTKPSS